MRIEKITYKDYNGVEHTETHYFHLNKVERMRLDVKYPGGLAIWAQKEVESGKMDKIFQFIEDVILLAHGVKSEDGARFIKDPEITKEFSQSEAYSTLVSSIFEDPDPTERLNNFLTDVVGANV